MSPLAAGETTLVSLKASSKKNALALAEHCSARALVVLGHPKFTTKLDIQGTAADLAFLLYEVRARGWVSTESLADAALDLIGKAVL